MPLSMARRLRTVILCLTAAGSLLLSHFPPFASVPLLMWTLCGVFLAAAIVSAARNRRSSRSSSQANGPSRASGT